MTLDEEDILSLIEEDVDTYHATGGGEQQVHQHSTAHCSLMLTHTAYS